MSWLTERAGVLPIVILKIINSVMQNNVNLYKKRVIGVRITSPGEFVKNASYRAPIPEEEAMYQMSL